MQPESTMSDENTTEATVSPVTEANATQAEAAQSEENAPAHHETTVHEMLPHTHKDEVLPSRGEDPRPYIVVTAILDSNARVANITLSHADAWERAQKAMAGKEIAGIDIVELPVPPRAFTALREHTQRSPETVAVYDLFPLAAHLDRATRKVAGQFLGAEVLWALEEQGTLSGIPLNLRLDVPRTWGDRSPKAVHEKLMEAGALDLTERAIDDFKAIKGHWDQA